MEQYLIDEEFIASLDYLVAASLWASISDARSQAAYYHQHVGYYKYHDGKEGKLLSNIGGTIMPACVARAVPTGSSVLNRKSNLAAAVQSNKAYVVKAFLTIGNKGCGQCRSGATVQGFPMVGVLCSWASAGGAHPCAGLTHR